MSSAIQTGRASGIDSDWTSAGIAGVIAGIAFGLVFAGIVAWDPLEQYARRWTTGIGLGVVYGGILGVGYPLLR